MKAAVYYGPGDIRVQDMPLPVAGPGDVLVRVLRSGLCGTDVTEWVAGPRMIPLTTQHPFSGHRGPMIPGHEIIGEIVSAPAGSGLEVGTVAASGAQITCGTCRTCRTGRINVCERLYTLGLNRHGGHAEFVSGPAEYWLPLPAGLSVDAAGLAQPLSVGIHGARRLAPAAGDSVAVIGAGAIGSFILAALRHLCSDLHITVSDRESSRLDRAMVLGADRVVLASDQEGLAAREFDVVIEATGAPGLLNESIRLTRSGGSILAVGIPASAELIDAHDLVVREITLISTNALVTQEDLPVALEILRTTNLAEVMLDSVRPLEAITSVLDGMASGAIEGKVLLDPHA